MKPRPRSVERKVAKHLSGLFIPYGYSAVERIPVLGREGPDISINETKLVIDVKSRIQVPVSYMQKNVFVAGNLIGIPLNWVDKPLVVIGQARPSVIVNRWYAHMDEWTKTFCPGGITALVLHRPKVPVGQSVLIIHLKDKEIFQNLWITTD